jgi:CheY-like chemotaxis protein
MIMARLVVIHPSLAGSIFELGESWATIGRGDGNTFQIIETSVSGRHCEVRLNAQELVVRDLNSTNGTFVGGKKITEATLKADAILRLGNVELRFELSAPATKIPAAPPAPGAEHEAKSFAPTAAVKTFGPPTAGDGPRRFEVLFVDDSLAFLENFGSLCRELSKDTWEVHTASTADRALAVLQQQAIDLVVLDIGMPTLDGIQLLGIINRRYAEIKIAVLTGLVNEANRAACLTKGAELFLEKPVSAESIKVAFNMLNDLLLWSQRDGFSGSLRQVGLTDVIQMECLGRQSLVLEIRNRQTSGQIFIEAGKILHATMGKLSGEKAFQQLLALNGGEFQFLPFRPPPERTVQGSWEFLLMEAARLRDENTSFITKPGAAGAMADEPGMRFIAHGENVIIVDAENGNRHSPDAPATGGQP